MKKKTLICFLTGVSLYGLALQGSDAIAQTTESDIPPHKPLFIKLGVLLPSNHDVKDSIGDQWYSIGIDYAFNQTTSQKFMPIAYVDYAVHSKLGIKGDYIGTGSGFRYYFTPTSPKRSTPYIGLGLGAYFLYASGYDNTVGETRFGFKVNAGLEFRQKFFIEANYTNPGSADGIRFDGSNLMFGFRF